MPITPLHFGVLAPVNHVRPGTVSLLTFTLVNLAMDMDVFTEIVLGIPTGHPIHGPDTHSVLAAVRIALLIGVWFIFSKRRWAYVGGALYGGITHVVLDMLCHQNMQPLYPPASGNPFYIVNGLTWVSWAMLPWFLWWLYQEFSFCRRVWTGHIVDRCAKTWWTDIAAQLIARAGRFRAACDA